MRLLFLLLFTVACSTSKYYRAPEVTSELKKNAKHLDTLTAKVEADFTDKQSFLQSYAQAAKSKNPYVMEDLAWRLKDMKEKKEAVLSKSAYIKEANNELIHLLNKKNVVKENDPEFKKIENFSNITSSEGKELLDEFQNYKSASEDFVKFALITGDIIQRQ